MEIIGIILTFILGISILCNVSYKFDLLEILGFSFLLGIGIQTFLMFFINFLGFKYSIKLILTLSILIIILLTIIFFIKRYSRKLKGDLRKEFKLPKVASYNLVWFVCFAIIVFIVYIISLKSLFWPTFSLDSLTAFDLFAKALAREGKILNSLVLESRVGAGASYPPLYSLSLAYSYMLGFELSKIIPVLFFISFAISFYSIIKKIINPTNAIFFTLFAISTPEVLAHSAINITNVPQAIYATLGVLSIIAWSELKELKYFYLSAIMMSFNAFTRSEGIVYILPVLLFLTIQSLKTKEYKKIFLFFTISLIPFILWQFFLKTNNYIMEQYIPIEIIKYPNFDFNKIKKILKLVMSVIKSTQFFGIAVYLFIAMVLLNIPNIIKKKSNLFLLSIIFLSFFGYLALINQFKIKADSLDNIINYSGKRFFFGHVLLMWIYISTNPLAKKFFIRLEQWINYKKPEIESE